jgi:hypothetical protein
VSLAVGRRQDGAHSADHRAETDSKAVTTICLEQAAEKRPSAAFPLPTGRQACCGVLLQVRVVCQFLGLRISGGLHLGIFDQPEKINFSATFSEKRSQPLF